MSDKAKKKKELTKFICKINSLVILKNSIIILYN
jgi:hypothetical protein